MWSNGGAVGIDNNNFAPYSSFPFMTPVSIPTYHLLILQRFLFVITLSTYLSIYLAFQHADI